MSYRIDRINNLIRQEISELLHRQVKDPRLGGFITVTSVSTSPDLKYAKVYVSQLDDQASKQDILSTLSAAAGFFRRELTKSLRLRRIPELSFHWDESIERGARILDLMNQLDQE
ncbi:MAG: 30S ribosome-binding factor RbfA [Chloroflexi bacterium]|nr:30S ribosome-binding factor RbfA [Chloroflexota bacterium]